MKRIKLFLSVFCLSLLFFGGKLISADEQSDGGAGGFTVKKITPATPEVHAHSSFYDLQVKPGDELEIQAEVFNGSAASSQIAMGVNTAFTNGNGEINYTRGPKGDELDPSLKVEFSKIAQLQTSSPLILPAGAKKIVSLKIKVPQDFSRGVIMGSWYFEKEAITDEPAKKGISINNRFAYALAIKLTVNEEIKAPHLDLVEVTPNLNSLRKVINARIQNDQAAVTSNLDFHSEVTKENASQVLYHNDLTNRIMAANSNFNLPIFLGDKQLEPGKYTLHVTATTTDVKWAKKTWSWTKNFEISGAKAKQLNKKAVNDPTPKSSPKKNNNLLIILVSIIILLLLVIIILFFRRKKDKES